MEESGEKVEEKGDRGDGVVKRVQNCEMLSRILHTKASTPHFGLLGVFGIPGRGVLEMFHVVLERKNRCIFV
jgi:hypothetical protein